MAKQSKSIGMGERTYARVQNLILSMKELREQMQVVTDANGELRNSNGQLVEGLTAAQIQMGVWIDENGKAKDSLGRLVDGLSNVQVSMKEYIDQNGKLRNSQGKIIDGLSAAQKAAGAYRNELGDLMNAQGKVIRLSSEHAAQMRENEMKLIAQNKAVDGLQKSLVSSTGSIAMVTSNLMKMSGQTGTNAEMIARLTTATTVGVTAFRAGASAAKLLGTAKAALSGFTLKQFTAQMALNGATGNFALLAAGAAAAVFAGGLVMAMTNTGDAAQIAATKIDGLNDAMKTLQEMAAKNGRGIFNMKDVRDMMQEAGISQADQMIAGLNLLKDFEKKHQEARKRLNDLHRELQTKPISHHEGIRELMKKVEEDFAREFQGFDP